MNLTVGYLLKIYKILNIKYLNTNFHTLPCFKINGLSHAYSNNFYALVSLVQLHIFEKYSFINNYCLLC